ncbi:MAG: energy transducer TonB [Pseudomonadota bacterium]
MNFSHEKDPGKNFTGIAVVVLIHALVAWGIVSGLGTRMVAKMADAVETKIIEEVKPPPPKEVPPPPPPPEMKAPPPPFIPPVEVNVQQTPPPVNTMANTTNAAPKTTELQPPRPAAAPAPSAPTGVKSAAVVDFNSCAKPEYPKSSARNEETGTVTVSFLIGVDGKMKDSKVTKSSGFRDLDKAAQAAIGRCPFKPATVDGKPVETWHPVQYVWTLD